MELTNRWQVFGAPDINGHMSGTPDRIDIQVGGAADAVLTRVLALKVDAPSQGPLHVCSKRMRLVLLWVKQDEFKVGIPSSGSALRPGGICRFEFLRQAKLPQSILFKRKSRVHAGAIENGMNRA
jgi:hypothetical protein